MMKKLVFSGCLLFLLAIVAVAQKKQQSSSAALSPGAALLFEGVKTRLSVPEQNYIYRKLNFKLAADKKSFTDGENLEQSFGARALPTDMNKDGTEEIFVSFGNSYTSGMAGSSIVLYIKKAGGNYEANLGFPGTVPSALPTGSGGYPDLLIGGPGFEFPVWRWNGTSYIFLKKMKEKDWLKLKFTGIEEASKAYQGTVK